MRLLIVEDDQDLADALARGLGATGFACDVVADGAEGCWQAQEFAYAAIVLDLLLPSMNGFRVCRELRDPRLDPRPDTDRRGRRVRLGRSPRLRR